MYSIQEILELLDQPIDSFLNETGRLAKSIHEVQNGNTLTATAMLGFSNICKNQCLYCGMRAGSTSVPRYRMEPEKILDLFKSANKTGLKRAFLISGEDPKYSFESLLRVISDLKKNGMEWISLACGEFEKSQYQELHEAGADEYVLKFEMSQEETFNRLNPSTNFKKRMQAIEWIRELGLPLASGNIVDYPGQSSRMLAEDILLMKELEISWAPVIPYLPVKNTPLALEGGPGRQEMILKTISILRILLPQVNITAQQPGKNLQEGLSSEEGNLSALNAGANFLYADLLPASQAQDFHVIDHRVIQGLDHIRKMADLAEMNLIF